MKKKSREKKQEKKSWKRFTIALIITLVLVGGIVYSFTLVGMGLVEKALAVREILEIIISPFCLLLAAWMGADTVGQFPLVKNLLGKKQ